MLLHYFLTGLKPLLLDGPLPMTTDEFLRRAEDSLSEDVVEDLRLLLALKEGSFDGIKMNCRSAFLRALVDEMILIYGVVACALMKKMGLGAEAIREELSAILIGGESLTAIHGDTLFLGHDRSRPMLEHALEDPEPRVLERAIMTTIFSRLEEMASPDPFSVDQILVYFIKLLLCERLTSFDDVIGQKILDRLVSQVQGSK